MNRTEDRPVTFRAGGKTVGFNTFAAARGSLKLADVSEFQPDVHDAAYLAWSKAIVIRAMYGANHDDKAWYGGARRELLHEGGVKFLGIYQFLVPGVDAAMQAHALVQLLGPLRPGELPICDLETSAGNENERNRWLAWAAVIRTAYKIDPWLYSGLNFAQTHNLSPNWVAAYQSREPATPHQMWQFTDKYPIPGVGNCDCSVFRGSIGDLAGVAYQPAPAPSKPAKLPAGESDLPAAA